MAKIENPTIIRRNKAAPVRRKLTRADIARVLKYNPKTGHFHRWLAGPRLQEKPAGSIQNGCISIMVYGSQYTAHALAWLYVYGKRNDHIRHKNGDRTDNRLANLTE